jgi:phage shock protein E
MEKRDLTAEEFAETFKNTPGAILLDVRRPDEFDSGHLPGALNINISAYDFHEQVEDLSPDKEYFVYCAAGARSATACSYMATKGFTKLHNLIGGIRAWQGEIE